MTPIEAGALASSFLGMWALLMILLEARGKVSKSVMHRSVAIYSIYTVLLILHTRFG